MTGRAMADGSFEGIVDKHHAEIHGYLRRAVARPAKTNQLVEETFFRAFRSYRSLPADADVRAWLFAIATQLCRTHAKTPPQRPVITVGTRVERSATNSPRRAHRGRLPQTDSRPDVVILDLPIPERLALIMRRLHGLDYDAIGASLACSADTARAHVIQALRQIRRGRAEAIDGSELSGDRDAVGGGTGELTALDVGIPSDGSAFRGHREA